MVLSFFSIPGSALVQGGEVFHHSPGLSFVDGGEDLESKEEIIYRSLLNFNASLVASVFLWTGC